MAGEAVSAPLRYGVSDSVVFTGRVSVAALQAFYRHASIYVQPSFTEGFGLPVLEAMAAGVPVVVSDGGALPEVVGAAGVTVHLGSEFVAQLATQMKRLLHDSATQKKLVTMGYKQVRQFSWEVAAKQTFDVLIG